PGAAVAVAPVGEARLPGTANFFLGDDPAAWRVDVPTFGAVRYPDLYPGVDLIYRGRIGELKSEWIVAPGADPGAIRLRYGGPVAGLSLDEAGALHVALGGAELTETAPVVYQPSGNAQVAVAGAWALLGE